MGNKKRGNLGKWMSLDWNDIVEALQVWVAYRLPRWLVRESGKRIAEHATSGQWEHEGVDPTMSQALMRWEVR